MSKEIIVFLSGRPVGRVTQNERGKLEFVYDAAWRETRESQLAINSAGLSTPNEMRLVLFAKGAAIWTKLAPSKIRNSAAQLLVKLNHWLLRPPHPREPSQPTVLPDGGEISSPTFRQDALKAASQRWMLVTEGCI